MTNRGCFSRVQGVEAIQLDMMTYGSVTAAFSVYSDFLTYSGGVYSNKSGEENASFKVSSLRAVSGCQKLCRPTAKRPWDNFIRKHGLVSANCISLHLLIRGLLLCMSWPRKKTVQVPTWGGTR